MHANGLRPPRSSFFLERELDVTYEQVSLGRHSVFVGPNNCGKTTIMEALALLFGRDRLIRSLTEHDFFGGSPAPQDRIKVVASIGGFEGDDFTAYPTWFGDNRGVPKWFDPDTSTVHATRTNAAWPLVCQVAFAARFDRDSLEVETARYFHDDPQAPDVFEQGTWVVSADPILTHPADPILTRGWKPTA